MAQERTRTPRSTESTTEEQYVEVIGRIEEQGSPVGTAAIADMIKLSMPSVSEMLHRLSEKGLAIYTPYGGTTLSPDGRRLYANVIRRHRLWEVFLERCLDFGWEEVYSPACELEHATSGEVTEKMAAFLGHPEACPHGAPIPSANAVWPDARGIPLAAANTHGNLRVVRILREDDADCLRFLTDRGVIPGALVRVLDIAKFDGTATLEIDGSIKAIGGDVALRLRVEPDR